jgi:hypothetical protein
VTDDQRGEAVATGTPAQTRFEWHPVYAGKSPDDVLAQLTDDIARDQRAYKLAMDGAETSEHESLVAVMDLERRWGEFEFDWAEMDPRQLATRILRFEQERERRRESISFADYRSSGALLEDGEPAASGGGTTIPVMKIGLALLAILVLVLLYTILA